MPSEWENEKYESRFQFTEIHRDDEQTRMRCTDGEGETCGSYSAVG